ncbi:MAG: DNA translocase FtsK, partial [Lachnospiraceae bacterium]|nr:DNA translocase FtsK [Lachnospiraceae bacterium]
CNFHICGFIGNVLSSVMLGVFGSIGYVAPVLLFSGIIFYASNRGNIRAVYKMLAVEVLLLVLCGLAQLTLGGGYKEGQTLKEIYDAAGESGLGGGVIGGALVLVLHNAIGTIGAYLVLLLGMILSFVCITEKSFVTAVKHGSDRAYRYAKEDYGRRKEQREEKKEEKRLLREEQRVQGVNLNSTDLLREGVINKMAASDGDLANETPHPAYKEAYAAEEKALKRAVQKKAAQAAEPEKQEEYSANPGDRVFKGKITRAGGAAEEEKDEVPFEEDKKAAPVRKDEDVFVSHDREALREMGLFGEAAVRTQTGSSGGTIFDGDHSEKTESEPVVSVWKPEQARVPEFDDDTDWEPVEIPVSVPAMDQAPVTADTAKDRKQVVTATGKVIDTDAEEIIRKKAEKRKLEQAEKEEADKAVLQEIKKTEEKPKKPYVIPPIDLLKKGNGNSVGQSDQEFRETAIKLQQTLRNFGVGVTVTNISCGPTVTRYELHPEQGVKVSKIQALADDIKLNLAATDIRIEAPIPGKAAVGIEVPNKVNSMVYLRELLESSEFRKHPSKLAFAVGKDIGGQVIVADLAKMPHLLIAGQTGSGKSVGINTMIMSLIYRSSPDDVKLIMIDPKVVELSVYNGIPHLLIPVVTDPKKAAGALNWAVSEMMERYNKFAQSNVRDIKGYNARVQSLIESGDVPEEEIPAKLPQLVIIIDELADLMMVASGEVEDAICRLAQLARAAGIHLVIATQRPSVNVITGVIKANVPSRIAFSVASGVDSRTILDMNGAEKLLGNGDMLFYPSGYPKPLRVQGAFVSDSEVSRVTDFLKEQNENSGYNTEIEMKMSQPSMNNGSSGGSERDSLFTDAGKFIIEKDKASIGMLQRVFKIGFNRAARIMDQLAEAGVVGEEEGTKPRKILMSMEEFEAFLESGY